MYERVSGPGMGPYRPQVRRKLVAVPRECSRQIIIRTLHIITNRVLRNNSLPRATLIVTKTKVTFHRPKYVSLNNVMKAEFDSDVS